MGEGRGSCEEFLCLFHWLSVTPQRRGVATERAHSGAFVLPVVFVGENQKNIFTDDGHMQKTTYNQTALKLHFKMGSLKLRNQTESPAQKLHQHKQQKNNLNFFTFL